MDWNELLELAARTPMTDEERAEQRLSLAYGNTHLENAHITRDMIAEEARRIDGERTASGSTGEPTGSHNA